MTNFDPYSDEAQKNARSVSEWYDRIANNVEKCPFCDLKEKYILAETEGVALTMNLFPYIDGHLLLVSRRHFEQYAELTSDEWLASQKLINIGFEVLKKELGYENFHVIYRQGNRESGSSLKHWHMHILPITSDFLQYEKTQFNWVFQQINYAPRELAERLRKHVS